MGLQLLTLLNDVEDIIQAEATTSSVNGAQRSVALRYIADVLELIGAEHNFKFMRREFQFITTPSLTTGTASVANASAAVTLTTNYSVNLVGRYFHITDDNQPYLILSGTGGTAGTPLQISPPFQGTTNTAGDYEIYEPRVILPYNTKAVVDPMWRSSPSSEVSPTGQVERGYGMRSPTSTGTPVEYQVVEESKRPFATATMTPTAGSGTGTITGTPSTEWTGRTFTLANEQDKIYEITAVGTSTVTFLPLYSGTATTGTAITIDPIGSPVIRLANYPTAAEIVNCDLFVWPPKYWHNSDEVRVPEYFRQVILDGCRWLNAKRDGKDIQRIEYFYKKFLGAAGSAATGLTWLVAKDGETGRPKMRQRQTFMPGDDSPYPLHVSFKFEANQ